MVAGLLASSLSGPAFAQEADAFYEFLMARRLEAVGDMAGAIAALERAALADPGSAEVQAEIASFHLRHNDRDEAEAAGRAAIELDADNVEAHRVLGLLTAAFADGARNGSPAAARRYAEEAIDHLERAVDSPAGGTDIGLRYTLGRLYLRVGRDDEAVEVLGDVGGGEPGLGTGPADARAGVRRSRQSRRCDRRLSGGRRPGAARGGRARTVPGAGGPLPRRGRELYRRARGQSRTTANSKFRRIVVLLGAGRFDEVANLSAEAVIEHPDDLRFDRMRARGLFRERRNARRRTR